MLHQRQLSPVAAMASSFTVGRSLHRTLATGIGIVGFFFVGLGGWAAWAPLSGAVVAPAVMSPEGSRRTVQHLEGGIVRELLVRDGATVEAGQSLVVLDPSMARASHDVLLNELRTVEAKHWRLLQERSGDLAPPLPAEQLSDDARTLYEAQRALLLSRVEARGKRKEILLQRIAQLEEQITGLKSQIASQTKQLALLDEEARSVEQLVQKGYERRSRLLALRRSETEVLGARARNQASVAESLSAIGETRMKIDAVDSEHMEEVESQLAETGAKLQEMRDKLRAAADVLARTVIAAPVSGTVVEMRVHTVGGVVTPGQALLDIVPRDEELLIEARVAPGDIDELRPDLPARIILTGYAQRNMPRLEGKVREVSADRLVDSRTGQAYYLARVELSAAHVRQVAPDVSLKPGMPAEVMVMTGERTVLDYLLDPLLASFRKSFREH